MEIFWTKPTKNHFLRVKLLQRIIFLKFFTPSFSNWKIKIFGFCFLKHVILYFNFQGKAILITIVSCLNIFVKTLLVNRSSCLLWVEHCMAQDVGHSKMPSSYQGHHTNAEHYHHIQSTNIVPQQNLMACSFCRLHYYWWYLISEIVVGTIVYSYYYYCTHNHQYYTHT